MKTELGTLLAFAFVGLRVTYGEAFPEHIMKRLRGFKPGDGVSREHLIAYIDSLINADQPKPARAAQRLGTVMLTATFVSETQVSPPPDITAWLLTQVDAAGKAADEDMHDAVYATIRNLIREIEA